MLAFRASPAFTAEVEASAGQSVPLGSTTTPGRDGTESETDLSTRLVTNLHVGNLAN
jgi:hypothetical protein